MAQHYLIHRSGRGWYRPGAAGYTLNADEAGRFTHFEAERWTHPNGPDGPRDGLTFKHESDVPSGRSCEKDLRIHDLTVERDALRAGQEELSQALSEAAAQIETLKAQLRGAEAAADTIAALVAEVESLRKIAFDSGQSFMAHTHWSDDQPPVEIQRALQESSHE